jgi:hypothetical protein
MIGEVAAGLILTVSMLGAVAQMDGPLRESGGAGATIDLAKQLAAESAGNRRAPELRRALRRQQLEIAAGIDPAISMSDDWRLDVRQRSAVRQALGNDRWRRLGDARFQVQLRELQGWSDLRDLRRDSPLIYEQVEDSFRSTFGKLARDYVEERLGLDDMLDRKRDQLRNRGREAETEDSERESSGFRVSPRLSFGSNSYLGAKFQLRSSPFLSRFGLRLNRSFDSDEMGFKLSYQKGQQRFFVEHRFEVPELGDTTAFSVRMSF